MQINYYIVTGPLPIDQSQWHWKGNDGGATVVY